MQNKNTPTLATLTAKLNNNDREIVERIGDWFDSEASLIEAIKNDSDKLDEALHEYADGQVSVYTHDRYEWAASHIGEVAEHEKEAIACSDGNIENAIAYCWYETERDEARRAIEAVRNLLEELA